MCARCVRDVCVHLLVDLQESSGYQTFCTYEGWSAIINLPFVYK